MKSIIKFFDRLEDQVRTRLSNYPLTYAMIGGVGIVLFWRGVWHAADAAGLSWFWSIVISVMILLSTGLFVSFFVGENIILTGLKREKKLAEQTESEIRTEKDELHDIEGELRAMKKELEEIKKSLASKDIK